MKEAIGRIQLQNGLDIPQIGVGTWQLDNRGELKEAVKNAYELGYRLFDLAAAYGNEIAFAKAVRQLGLPREELILTDKAWNTSRGCEAVQEACKRSLKKLKTDYLDLYLIHWPAPAKLYDHWEALNADSWRGMESLLKEGVIRAAGVCNFKAHHLEALEKTAQIMPAVNQFELHPGMPQIQLCEACRKRHIQVEASSPLGNGQILSNRTLCAIARQKGRSAAQICLRWAIGKKAIVIPKTAKAERLKENRDIFDICLTKQEMQRIDELAFCGGLGIDSDEVVDFG